jgi:hypothetical protein
MQELIEQVRTLQIDHEPDGWPAIKLRDVTCLADALVVSQAAQAEMAKEIKALRSGLENACAQTKAATRDRNVLQSQIYALELESQSPRRKRRGLETARSPSLVDQTKKGL